MHLVPHQALTATAVLCCLCIATVTSSADSYRGGSRSRSGSGGASARSGMAVSSMRSVPSPAYYLNSVFLDLLRAIRILNYFMAQAGINPMDDFRRKQVQDAKREVDVKTEQLGAEVAKGRLTTEELASAKEELAEVVDQEAPLREYANVEMLEDGGGRSGEGDSPVAPAKAPPEEGSVRGSTFVTSVTMIQNAPARPSPAAPSRSLASAGKPQEPSRDEAMKTQTTLTRADALLAPGGAGASPLSGSVPDGAPLPVEKDRDLARVDAGGTALQPFNLSGLAERPSPSGSSGGPASTGSVGLRDRGISGTLRLEALTAAVADLKPGDVIGNIVPEGKDSFLHVTGDFSGGRVIAGNFGSGVAGVHLRRTPYGFKIETLTRGQLALAYLKIAAYWLAIGIPLFYACFLLGVKLTRRREPVRVNRRAA